MVVKVNDIIDNKSANNIMDLLYLIYIGKYIKEVLNDEPDFTDIDCTDIIGKVNDPVYTPFISYACYIGWINESLAFYNTINLDDFESAKAKSEIYCKSPDSNNLLDYYKIDDYAIEHSIKVSQYQFFYVNLISWLVVNRYYYLQRGLIWTKPFVKLDPVLFSYRFNGVFTTHIMRYAEVNKTINTNIKEIVGTHQHMYDFDCWVFDNTSKGNLRNVGYTITQKYQHIMDSKYYQIGLPVFYYEKSNNLTAGNVSGLKQVHIAIIRDIKPQGITLEITNIRSTHADVDKILNENDYLSDYLNYDPNIGALYSRVETLDYTGIGVDHLMLAAPRKWSLSSTEKDQIFIEDIFEEKYFIRGVGDDLLTNLHIQLPGYPENYTPGHKFYEIELSYADVVYWLLKEWKVDFNTQAFKDVYKNYLMFDKPVADLNNVDMIKALYSTSSSLNKTTALALNENAPDGQPDAKLGK